MLRRFGLFAAAVCLSFLLAGPVQASILTFEVFDPDLNFLPYNDPGVPPVLLGHGYPELFPIAQEYGDNVSGSPAAGPGGLVFQYGFGAEGPTPHVLASYGPFSLLTGGPNLWRTGYGDLAGVLFQASFDNGSGGTDYNILDVVLYGESGFDVVLYGFDIASYLTERTIEAVTVYPGVPFPFLTPTNEVFEDLGPGDMGVDVPGSGHLSYNFEALLGDPIQAPVIWIRINANNLGSDSELIAIDNIRFGEVESNNPGVDPDDIENALAQVPEPVSLLTWLLGGSFAAAVYARRRQRGVAA